jgi:hypothetical protein
MKGEPKTSTAMTARRGRGASVKRDVSKNAHAKADNALVTNVRKPRPTYSALPYTSNTWPAPLQ